MSADNFFYIQRHPNGGWAATMGFASADDLPMAHANHPRFGTIEEAQLWAELQYSEYGVSLSHAAFEELRRQRNV